MLILCPDCQTEHNHEPEELNTATPPRCVKCSTSLVRKVLDYRTNPSTNSRLQAAMAEARAQLARQKAQSTPTPVDGSDSTGDDQDSKNPDHNQDVVPEEEKNV